MNEITINVEFEVYNVNTDETFDRKSLDVTITDKQIRQAAKVMDQNGGFAPELPVFQKLDEYIGNECIYYYQLEHAPEDEDFWDNYMIDIGEDLPDELLKAAEEYVTHKDVDVVYYYEVEGQEKSGTAPISLKPAIYWIMVEAAKTKDSAKTDFSYLEEIDPSAFEEVRKIVAQKVDMEDIPSKAFTLKEFPYKVLENAMETM